MIELQGKYNSLKVFTDNIDNNTISQLINVLNYPVSENCKIRIMPDCHAGKGCVIGTTMFFNGVVVPNLVGSDIGCGVLVVKLNETNINFEKLDKVIREFVPHGASVHQKPIQHHSRLPFDCKTVATNGWDKYEKQLGTLGGGNHFIEIDKDDDNCLYLVIHTGSRLLGKDVCEDYQKTAINYCHMNNISVPDELAFLPFGDDYLNYLLNVRVAVKFAATNRTTIANIIMDKMNLSYSESFDTVHNYIENTPVDNGQNGWILRKGAVSALKGERLIIPINMRDGSLICVGKGNPDWNCSAPHGAGRIMSRSDAKTKISLEAYQSAMEGVFTTCVNRSTIDESPMAYKDILEIMANISDTVAVEKIIKPIYNFKSSK